MSENQFHTIGNENSQIIRQGFYIKEEKKILLPTRSYPFLWTDENLKDLGTEKVHPFPATKVYCSNEKTVDFVLRMKSEGQDMSKVGILHFVNAIPNGLEKSALLDNQEGDLLRCSDLKRVFSGALHGVFYGEDYDNFHSLKLGCIVSSDVTIFRDSQYKLLDEPITVHCVSAMPFSYLPFENKNLGVKMMAEGLQRERMFYVLCILFKLGCTSIGLGAFGCGEEGLPASVVAFRWSELLTFMADHFSEVVMPVPESKDVVTYRRFIKEFNK